MDSFSVVGERDSIFPFPFMSCLFLFSLFLLSLRDQKSNKEKKIDWKQGIGLQQDKRLKQKIVQNKDLK